jgi:hypothetical protein
MPDQPGDAREAARKASDPDRLLPNEDPDSRHADDAEHWIDVYRELLQYKDRLLAVTQTALSQEPDEPARREVAETDRTLILAERERFARRLGFWTHRLTELKP